MTRPNVILQSITFPASGAKNSIQIDSDNLLELVGDVESPGNDKVYGTDSSGERTWLSTSSFGVADGAITNAKLADMAQSTIKGRAESAGTGVPVDLTIAQVKAILDYAGADVANTPAGSIAATTVQAAIDELDTEKQPIDADLTAIAALTPTNDDILQRKTGAWTNRTAAQFKTDLVLVKSDVGLGNVDNTADASKPVSSAQQTAINLKLSLTGGNMTGILAMGGNKIISLGNGTNPTDAVNKSQLDSATISNYWQRDGLSTQPGSGSVTTTLKLNSNASSTVKIENADGSAFVSISNSGAGGNLTLLGSIFLSGVMQNTITSGGRLALAHSSTVPGLTLSAVAGDPSSPSEGGMWYNDTLNLLRARIGSANISLSGSSNDKQILTRTIDIGDWDMDAAFEPPTLPAHGIADYKKIRSIDVIIRDDSDNIYMPLDSLDLFSGDGTMNGGVNSIGATRLILSRKPLGQFDGDPAYSATSYNRGFIHITYEV